MEENINKYLNVIFKGTVLLILGAIISKVLALIYRIIIARSGVETYGLFSLGLTFYSLALSLSLLGYTEGIVKFVSSYIGKADYGNVRNIISSSLLFVLSNSITASIIIFIFSSLIAVKLFHNIELSPILKILSIAIPFNAINIIENITKIILTVVFLAIGYEFGIPLAYSASIILTAVLAFYFLNKKFFNLFRSEYIARYYNKELFMFSLPLMFYSFIAYLMTWTDTIMIGFFKEAYSVGLYNGAIPIAQLLHVIPVSIYSLFLPVLSSLYAAKNYDVFKKTYIITTKWGIIFNLFIVVVLFIFSNQILGFLFGTEYQQAGMALKVLALGYFVAYVAYNPEAILLVLNKTKLILYNSIVALIINVILNILLIPQYGITGAAIASSISFLVMFLLHIGQVFIFTRINPLTIKYLSIIISMILSLFIFSLISNLFDFTRNIYIFIVGIFIFFSMYLLFLIITKAYDEEDIELVKSVKNKLMRR